jgi:hypothetical protein
MKPYLIAVCVLMLVSCSPTSSKISSERENPTSYLETILVPYKVGDLSLEGKLLNKSKFTDFSNVVLYINYFSYDDKKMGSERIVLHEIIKSKSQRNFKKSISPPESCVKVNVLIKSAMIAEVD